MFFSRSLFVSDLIFADESFTASRQIICKSNLVPRVLSLPTSRRDPGCGWSCESQKQTNKGNTLTLSDKVKRENHTSPLFDSLFIHQRCAAKFALQHGAFQPRDRQLQRMIVRGIHVIKRNQVPFSRRKREDPGNDVV